MHIQTSFLANRFWLWTGVGLSLVSLFAFWWHAPLWGRDGSSAVGYALGAVSGALVLYLAWLGVRKRRFRQAGRRRDQVSAHVFLGLTLIVTATLHTGFEFEWSVHMLTYVLMMVVVLSGIWGITVYARIPARMSRNLSEMLVEKKRFDMSAHDQLDLDMEEGAARLERALQFLPDAFRPPVQRALRDTRVGAGLGAMFAGDTQNCASARAVDEVRALIDQGPGPNAGEAFPPDIRQRLTGVMRDLARRREVAACLRRDARYRTMLKIWLWLHVPMTSALVVTLFVHVFITFFYW